MASLIVVNPATGHMVAEHPMHTAAETRLKVRHAADAWSKWSRWKFASRAEVLRAAFPNHHIERADNRSRAGYPFRAQKVRGSTRPNASARRRCDRRRSG